MRCQKRRVRCFPRSQPTLAHALLAVLPATLRQLKLEIQCFNPLFLLLRRFPRLESFSIGGSWNANGAELQWDSRAAAAVLPKRLEFRGEVEQEGNFVINDAPISAMPATWPPALAAATRLSSLELRAAWSTEVSQLCVALPALQHLRCGWCVLGGRVFVLHPNACECNILCASSPTYLPACLMLSLRLHALALPRSLTLYTCTNEHVAEAVRDLAALPAARPRGLKLSIHSGTAGTYEDPVLQPEVDEWDHWVHLPPMAPLADRLTSLTLSGAVR